MSRVRITRLAELGETERRALDELLDDVFVAHVALVRDAEPMIVPTAVARDGDEVLMHGSTGSSWMRSAAAGAPMCLAVTAMDGLIVARSAFESSMRYRSAVLFGRCRTIDGAHKLRALDVITDRLIPGRAAEVRRPRRKELAATLVLALPIQEWSLKVSDGWPEDPASDVVGDAWAGVVPHEPSWGIPLPAPDLRAGIGIPPSVQQLSHKGG